MRAAVWTGPNTVEVVDHPDPSPLDGNVLVRVAYTGICGTDLHIVAGEHPRARPGVVLGHEFVGTLESAVDTSPAGTPVAVSPLLADGTCEACRRGTPWICERLRLIGIDVDGGLAPLVSVPSSSIHPLPESVSLESAAFFEPLSVAVRAVRRGRVGLGSTVVVVGAGPIGRAIAMLCHLAGASFVGVVEPATKRRVMIEADPTIRALSPDDPLGDFVERTGARPDVVFDAAGVPAVALQAPTWVRAGGIVVVAAVYGAPTPVDLQAINFREVQVIGTRVYEPDDIATAIDLLADGRFDPTPIITGIFGIDQLPEAITALSAGKHLKVLVAPGDRP